ncbi:MAG: PAS-domain containing protein [Gemmobacter sp.]|uniref:sensor histidine kinase n=1 Tax=Gemmobacter sp. TaxID=1898957 RepID=UPI001A37A3E3|nr:PAS domain-containing sensor histidine kinase [Gemmobacter sp.]MBL8560920.1 PAS-domain containing protein [Gemmobacter sp.]
MSEALLNPADSLERQRDKLLIIAGALMRRVEAATDDAGAAYAQFQRAALLEDEVRDRTRDLQAALQALNDSNARLEQATRAAEAARRALADAIGAVEEGFALFGPDEALILCNPRFCAAFADVQPHLRPGLRFADYIDRVSRSAYLALPEGETPAQWAAARSARHGAVQAVFNVGLVRDRWVQVSERRMVNGATVILQTDVTEAIRSERQSAQDEARAEAMAEAGRINTARARFVAAASHDLLQPLAAARLFIGAASDGGPEGPEALLKAQNALGQVEGILSQLLDISRLETGRMAVQPGPLRLEQVLAPLRDEFGVIAAARGLRFTLRPCSATVISDPQWLRRILQNLIGNALRYTRKGRVLVGARILPGALRIEVHDTGPGIAEADRAAIFAELHRLDAPASAAEGMGLGLAIVERAAGALGHGLGLRSTPGRGSCFSVTLPLSPAKPTGTGPKLSPGRPVPDRPRSR